MPESWYELAGILLLCFCAFVFGNIWARRNDRIRKK